jgi:aldehyde dehydrogenase (NAD+)
MSPTARGKLLRKIAALIEQHAEHLAKIEVRDNGKLMSEMHAQTKYLPEWFYYYGGLADKIEGAVVPADRPDHFNYILREPVGVCAFITPWNSPLMLVGWKLAPALAAGCTVVLKPSEFTSASLLEFMKLVIEPAELPPGVINVVTGYGAVVGEPLVTHPKVAKVAFTGGSVTGARVNELAAQSFKKVSLELGGKSPVSLRQPARPASPARACCCRKRSTTGSWRSWSRWRRSPGSVILASSTPRSVR